MTFFTLMNALFSYTTLKYYKNGNKEKRTICQSNRFFPILDCTCFKMPVSSLPNECFNNVLSFLDRKTLYKCLFVNRYYCKFAIPLIWEEPYFFRSPINSSLINTLLACLNEDEISSLIPCAIKFYNDQSPLF